MKRNLNLNITKDLDVDLHPVDESSGVDFSTRIFQSVENEFSYWAKNSTKQSARLGRPVVAFAELNGEFGLNIALEVN